MAKFRTKKSNRTSYVYKDAYGRTVMELCPGMDGVTEAEIAALHRYDDDEINAQKRDSYHGLLHYEQMGIDGTTLGDRQADLADHETNPESILLTALEAAEQTQALAAIWAALSEQQQALVIKKLQGRTNTDIANEEGVTEAAIRNRWKKIQRKYEKLFS